MYLICPVCGKKLIRENREAYCERNHHFDYAKSGYVNLLIGKGKIHGDDANMVKARTRFLESGSYEFLRDRLAELAGCGGVLADLGCGEGYYTRAFKSSEKYGFDLSRDAVSHAAKKDKETNYAVASIFHLPLEDECCDTAVTCFAPHAKDEIMRILKPGGRFIFVTPGPGHLFEMKAFLYETPYENTLSDIDTELTLVHTEQTENKFLADTQLLNDLFMMTPYFWRTPEKDRKRLEQADAMEITAQFIIRVYQK